MTAFTTNAPRSTRLFSFHVFGLVAKFRSSKHKAVDQDDARQRRDFVTDMLARNPQAFSTNEDMAAMMCLFPDRF